MKVSLLCLLVLFASTVTTSYGQASEPLEVARQIFGKTKFDAIKRYSTGEYEGRPNGQDLPPGATTRFLLLGQDEKRAVVAMTIQGADGKALDTYLHFKRDTVWKLSAFRALAMTGMIEQAKKELEQMTPAQVDKLIASSAAKKDKKEEVITSRADYEYELGNFSLVLESDDRLIEHFRKNQAEFARLRDLALAQASPTGADEMRGAPVLVTEQAAYRKLFISSIRTEHATGGKRLNFLIGGILDNSVGYFYVTDKQAVPTMNPGDVIMIREIGNGWYLYKTT
ncbi:hypothetical protein GCM10027422_17090 [Hymenobacter arcticus]